MNREGVRLQGIFGTLRAEGGKSAQADPFQLSNLSFGSKRELTTAATFEPQSHESGSVSWWLLCFTHLDLTVPAEEGRLQRAVFSAMFR